MFNRYLGVNLVVSVNRVRAVNIDLAVFNRVFVSDPSFKSIFAQNESCRFFSSSTTFILTKFQVPISKFENWRVKTESNHSISLLFRPVQHCVGADAHTDVLAVDELVHASAIAPRRSSSSERRPYHREHPGTFPSHPVPLLLPQCTPRSSRARNRSPSRL